MADTKIETTDFRVKKLDIKISGYVYDISLIFQELNLFDNMFSPCSSGNVLIVDAVGLFDMLNKKSSDKQIIIQIDKGDNNKQLEFYKEFQINDITHIKNINTTSKSYIINFISKTFFKSEKTIVDTAYGYPPGEPMPYSAEEGPNIVANIFKDYLDLTPDPKPQPPKDFLTVIDPSKGFRKVNIPSLKPLDALEWITYRATAEDLPQFFIFETHLEGFRFTTLSNLKNNKGKPPKFEFNFGAKNIRYANNSEQLGNDFEFLGVRNFKFLSSANAIKNVNSGVYGGKFRGFDPLIREYTNGDPSEENKNVKGKLLLNDQPIEIITASNMDKSRLVSYYYEQKREKHSWISKKDSSMIPFIDDTQNYAFQRKALIRALTQRTIEFAIPGNFALTSGSMVKLNVPHYESNLPKDPILSGKYLVTGVRHILRYNIHETIVTLSTNSVKF